MKRWDGGAAARGVRKEGSEGRALGETDSEGDNGEKMGREE